MKIGEIERTDVERLHRTIGKSAPGAANRALALVPVVMSNAEGWGYRPPQSNPCRGIGKFRERKMERFLSAEERARLDAVLSESERTPKGHAHYVAPGSILAVRLLSLTGARSGEITSLQWSMVDLEHGCLRLPDSKTGAKVVPLTPPAVALLRATEQRAEPGPWDTTTGALTRALWATAHAFMAEHGLVQGRDVHVDVIVTRPRLRVPSALKLRRDELLVPFEPTHDPEGSP